MANKKEETINGKKVTVIIEDPNENKYTIDIFDYKGPAPGEYPPFTILGKVADIKITEGSEKDTTKGKGKKVKLKKITIETEYSQSIFDKAEQKKKDLELFYYYEDEWQSFEADGAKVKTTFNKNNKTGKVVFKDFVLDPPVGWGFK